jgi:hypothetical protein
LDRAVPIETESQAETLSALGHIAMSEPVVLPGSGVPLLGWID